MRKLLPVVLLTATLLPGCVLAIGNTPDEEGGPGHVQKLEHRIAELEARLSRCEDCMEACEADMSAEHAGMHEKHEQEMKKP